MTACILQVATLKHGALHTDIPRLREGGAGAQFWSVYVPTSVKGAEAVQQTLEQVIFLPYLCAPIQCIPNPGQNRTFTPFPPFQVDIVHRLCEKYPESFEFAWTADDVERIFRAGKIASMCGAEGGPHRRYTKITNPNPSLTPSLPLP